MNIPKIIHYCWFGHREKPALAKKCIDSWRRFFPGWEIREWNEDNFDVNEIAYAREAYAAKKYAFVSDYARFKILYEHGGVYFDTDVEVLRPMDAILERGAFMGLERDVSVGMSDVGNSVNPGLGLACAPGLGLYEDILNVYRALHFEISPGIYNFKTVVQYTSEILLRRGLVVKSGIMKIDDVFIYPSEYFSPKSWETGEIRLTANTYTIHHFAASWHSHRERIYYWVKRHFGAHVARALSLVFLLFRNPKKNWNALMRRLEFRKKANGGGGSRRCS